MIRLGITGGSGCGKTTVSEYLRKVGIPVIDADQVAREVVMARQPALEKIREEFGGGVILPDGNLDRQALGNLVFRDEKKLEKLNQITHPYIKDRIDEWIRMQTGMAVGIDAAALLESGIEYDCLLAVLADAGLRRERIERRDKLTEEQATDRIRAQRPDSYYAQHADFIIYNNGKQKELEEAVNRVIEKLGSMT
jgi:dephospho-CoA kinase